MNINTYVYAVKHKDAEVVKNSSSGGLFTALSDYYLGTGNAVSSCVYNKDTDCVEFKIYEDYETRNEARGSKYIQADIVNGFKNIYEWLITYPNKSIMVVGTGCQMEGLRRYLEINKLRDRVLLVDLICHGATSPELWKRYIKVIGAMRKIEDISFKDKRKGWHNPTVYVKVNGKEKSINGFAEWFYGNWAIRRSCYKCPFAKIERNTDITIGDFWGIEKSIPSFSDDRGVSLALIHSEKGFEVFNNIKEFVEYCESDKENCLQPRLKSPAEEPKDRETFWEDINKKGIKYCKKKYKEKRLKNYLKAIKTKVYRRIGLSI